MACIDAGSPFGKSFDSFSAKLYEIRDQSSLQLKFVELFFFKSVLAGLIETPRGCDLTAFAEACGRVELALRERHRIARMRFMASRLSGEEKLACVVDELLECLAVLIRADIVGGYKRESVVASPGASDSEDVLSQLVTSISSGSSEGSVPRFKFRRCSACDAPDASNNVTRRVSGVLIGSARKLFG